jgi:uncharacterized membrane protein (UPF0127 family)
MVIIVESRYGNVATCGMLFLTKDNEQYKFIFTNILLKTSMIFQFITQVEMYLPNNPLKNTLFDHYV